MTGSQLSSLLSTVVAAGFAVLGFFAIREWVQTRSRPNACAALAMGLLAFVAVLGRVQRTFPSTLETDLSGIGFMASGFALLAFRDAFIPLRRGVLNAAAAATVVVCTLIVLGPISSSTASKGPLTGVIVVGAVGVWLLCVLEPVLRFWRASRGRPRVQQGRLRALSLGCAGICVILILAVVAGNSAKTPAFQVFIDVIALIIIPLLWAAFSPPAWLRDIWRASEEDALRSGLQGLLFAPDSATVADQAAEWATRLVGAESAFIVDTDTGQTLAAYGIDDAGIGVARATLSGRDLPLVEAIDATTTIIALAVKSEDVRCQFVVISGPFTPVFGYDELDRLSAYATSVALSIARVRLTERLAGVERAKTAFLNLASHELRGPLTVIRGYVSMVAQGDFGSFPALDEIVIPALMRQSEQMSLLIEQMIDTARLEDERLELHMEAVSLPDIVRNTVADIVAIGPPGASIVVSGDVPGGVVKGDRERLRTIVLNLVDNAVKYSPNGVDVDCVIDGDETAVHVTVSDRGVGVAEEQMTQLFTRFGRIVSPETAHISGTGLGLYLCRELARRHQGDLTATRREGGGMTFELIVPRLIEDATPVQDAIEPDTGAAAQAADTPEPADVEVARGTH